MENKKQFFCAVFCILQLLAPCESGIMEAVFTNAVKLFMSGEGCFISEDSCPNSNISYYLYTRDTQDPPHQLDPSDADTITSANFVEGVPLKVIIHGYTGHKDFSPNVELRPAYFAQGEYNIIAVDWSALAALSCYTEAAQNVYVVAECAAQFLDSLYSSRSDLSINNTHIIGFSLGAHVAGLLGNNLKTGKVRRVTGLDPAMPLFDQLSKSRDEMINSDAAQFVDVYHSNAGYEGKKAACGHVDVYFNDGTSQPGCNCTSSCDHKRSVEYFTESISSATGLWGFVCSDWDNYIDGSCAVTSAAELVNLGDSISTSLSTGKFIAITESQAPFLIEPSIIVEDNTLASKVQGDCSMVDYIRNFH